MGAASAAPLVSTNLGRFIMLVMLVGPHLAGHLVHDSALRALLFWLRVIVSASPLGRVCEQ